MKVVLALLLCTVALVSAQAVTTIDEFIVDQTPLSVNADKLTDQVFVSNAAIFGGERDTGLELADAAKASCRAGIFSTTNVNTAGFLDANGDGINDNPGDLGIFVAANDQSCFAAALLQYDGVDGSVNRGQLPSSLRNFNTIGSAFHIRYYSDLAGRNLQLRVGTGSTTCTTTLTTSGGQAVDDKTISFGQFTAGCDFNAIDFLEIFVPAQSNFDVTISIFELLTTALSGRVYVDCACDGTFNSNDQGLSSVTVTATPGANCPSGTPTKTITTNGDGTYRFTGLAACTYTVSPTVSTFTPCSGSSRTGTTSFGNEVTNVDFPYRGTSAFDVPDNIEIFCNQDSSPSSTGTATSSSFCDGGRTVTFTDTVTAGSCDAKGTISRRWTDGTNSGTQTITIKDTAVGPNLSCPGNTQVECDSSLLPSVTGRPSVSDDCSSDIDVTYTGSDVDGACDGGSCTRNKIVTRVFRAVDDCGNAALSTCTQTITITPCASAKTCPSPANCHNGSIFYRDGVAQN